MKERKIVYCKYCGGELDENRKCTKCGKQFFHIKSKSVFMSFMIIVILVLLYKNYSLEKSYEKLKEINYFVNIDYEDMSEQYDILSEELDYYKGEAEACFDIFDDMGIVFHLKGEKFYHKASCNKIQNNTTKTVFYDNIDVLERKGYKKCPDCYK